MLNLTDLLKMLFNEPVSSGKTFDKQAKKIIRSHYKLIQEKPNPELMEKAKFPPSQSERKDYSARTAFSALTEANSAKTGMLSPGLDHGKKIVNYYNGENIPKGNFILK